MASKPALSAMVLGITSRALAKALTTSCCLPLMLLAWWSKCLESSSSVEPAPATILEALMALLTIMIASLRDLSASWTNCSAPPLITRVAVLLYGKRLISWHSQKKLYLRAVFEDVESFSTDLDFFEFTASTHNVRGDAVNGSLDLGSSSLDQSL